MSRSRVVRLLQLLVLCAACLLGGAAASAAQDTGREVAGWRERLAHIESDLRQLPADDGAARGQLASALSRLHEEVAAWLARFPTAVVGAETWFEAQPAGSGVAELASEIGRLRSLFSRIESELGGGEAGAFYLGRVEVSVTAEASVSAATEATPAGATVLNAADFRLNDRQALAGALALAPGVTFTRIGQRNEGAVYVRGYDMRQVPLFIDGIPIYTPYDGYVDLDRFTTFDVSEVRVSKGFASVLYGPNALGGAINIVTRRPSRRLQGTAGAGYGSGSARNAYLNAGSRLERWYVQGSASYLDSRTFPLAGAFTPVRAQPGGDRVNAARQDARFGVKVGWTPAPGDEYAVSYVGQRGEKGNPPYAGVDPLVRTRYWRWPYWDKDSFYFVSNKRLGPRYYLRARAYRDAYDNALRGFDDATYSTQLRPSSFRSLYRDRTFGGSLEWGATLGRHALRAAGHFKKDAHQDSNIGEPPKEFEGRLVSSSVEDSLALSPRLSLVAGAGADRQTTTLARDYQKNKQIDLMEECRASGGSCGNAGGVNAQAGLFYSVSSGQLRLTAARKTRMPSMKDRYSYKFGTAVPNPGLKAERNLTFEAGYQGALGARTSFHASVFYSRIDDLIQRFYLAPNLSQQRNIGRASHSGFELDARTRVLPRLDIAGSYTFLRRENLSDPSSPLVDTPAHKGHVTAIGEAASFLQLVVGIDFEMDRRTQNDAGRYFDAPSFAVVNVKGVWTIARRVDAELAVFNAFDASYWLAEGYPEPGRTAAATLRWKL